MGIIFYWFSILSWIGHQCSIGIPIRSRVYFDRTFTSDPKSRMTWSISCSPIYVVSLISLPVLVLCFPIFSTTCGSPGTVPTHLLMSSCNPFTTLLLCSNFIHVSMNVVSMDGSIFDFGLYFLPEVKASTKLFLASMRVSWVCSKSNSTSFVRALWTQVLSFGCLPLSSPIAILV